MPNEQSPPAAVPSDVGLIDRLRSAFRTAMIGGRGMTDELRVAVCDYVRDLRERGESPESAVISTKEVVRRSAAGQTPTHDSRRETDALIERVVTLCIEEYYRGSNGGGGVVA